jgi:Spy/CpxP family protein refolding chaperone
MKAAWFLSLAIPALVTAQVPRSLSGGLGQWWDSPLANGLNLTDAQNKQIRSIVAEYRSRLIDLRAAEQKAQGDLQDVFNDTPTDQRKANEVIDRLGNARGETTRVISQMSLRLRNVLSNEQWQVLRERQENRPRRMLRPPMPDSKADPNAQRPGGRRFGQGGPPADPNAPQAQPVKPTR